MQKQGDVSRRRRLCSKERKRWYGFYRTLRHQRRLFKEAATLEAQFGNHTFRIKAWLAD